MYHFYRLVADDVVSNLFSEHSLQVIIGGAQEEISLQKLIDEVNQQVQQEAIMHGGEVDEVEVTAMIHGRMKSKGEGATGIRQGSITQSA